MSSFKCEQCNMVNWATAETCKRCGAAATRSNAEQTYQERVAGSLARQNQPTQPAPPPPDYFGADFGHGSGRAPRRPFAAPRANYAELEAAEADIRKAWKAGRVWCIFAGAVSVLMFAVLIFLAASSPRVPAWILLIPIIVLVPILAIGSGLVYGVYKKSRACAVVLLGLMCLSIVSNLLNIALSQSLQSAGSLLFASILCYYFALGVRGTFKYHNLIK